MQTSEYDIAQGIYHEPAFNWWVRHTLKKRDHIISLVHKLQTRYLKKTHKFGIELPNAVAEDHDLDKKNGNTLWDNAILKEMKNMNIAFDIMPDGECVPNDYKQICCPTIFDVKTEDFRRKERLVADGNMTKTPKCQT